GFSFRNISGHTRTFACKRPLSAGRLWEFREVRRRRGRQRRAIPSGAKTPPKSDHTIIGGSTQPQECLCLRKFGPTDIVLEPGQRLRHASAMNPLPPPLAFFFLLFAGWVNRHQQAMIDYLLEENRVLRAAQESRRL